MKTSSKNVSEFDLGGVDLPRGTVIQTEKIEIGQDRLIGSGLEVQGADPITLRGIILEVHEGIVVGQEHLKETFVAPGLQSVSSTSPEHRRRIVDLGHQ